jgi:outer membrane protein assembly factor BamD (BamD/ComL family)
MHYFKRRAYEAAVVYFEEAIAGYPDTEVAPEALGQLFETYTRMGWDEEATETRERLLRDYPNSPEAQRLADLPEEQRAPA